MNYDEHLVEKNQRLKEELESLREYTYKLEHKIRNLEEGPDAVTTLCEEYKRRTTNQARVLSRIREKADLAMGYNNESGGFEEAALKGRATGAEGAVDLLIAKFAGLKSEIINCNYCFREYLYSSQHQLNISNKELASAFDVSVPAVERWLRGKYLPATFMRQSIYSILQKALEEKA